MRWNPVAAPPLQGPGRFASRGTAATAEGRDVIENERPMRAIGGGTSGDVTHSYTKKSWQEKWRDIRPATFWRPPAVLRTTALPTRFAAATNPCCRKREPSAQE